MRILVTGGCGFIGSCFVRHVLAERGAAQVVNLDALTYAGNLENLADLKGEARLEFVKGSILDEALLDRLFRTGFDIVFNFAAETHVDRSLYGPADFARTNLEGVVHLLEAARRHGARRFVQVSTDEVYGSLPPEGSCAESAPLAPGNPYSASKAAADLMVQAYVRTFGLDAVITRSSNNYGPCQHPEKFIPLFITNALEGRECPLYGDGGNVREWLHVEDNCRGILAAGEEGRAGEVYNLGGGGGADEPGGGVRPPAAGGAPRIPGETREGPAGARPPLLDRFVQGGARARMVAARAVRGGFEPHGGVVPRERGVGGAREERGIPPLLREALRGAVNPALA